MPRNTTTKDDKRRGSVRRVISSTERQHVIEQAAYKYAEKDNFKGNAQAYWDQAEREVDKDLKRHKIDVVDSQLEHKDTYSDLVAHLKRHPAQMRQLPPRRFEELIAELLADMGCAVQLTPPTRDGGRDVLAVVKTQLGELLTLVECKRYAPHRLIGPSIVERFLWTIRDKDRASCGLIATTSFFTAGAHDLQKTYHWQLKLKDFDHMKDWLGTYGKWSKTDQSSLWLPKQDT